MEILSEAHGRQEFFRHVKQIKISMISVTSLLNLEVSQVELMMIH